MFPGGPDCYCVEVSLISQNNPWHKVGTQETEAVKEQRRKKKRNKEGKEEGKREGGREGRRELFDQFEETGGLPFS